MLRSRGAFLLAILAHSRQGRFVLDSASISVSRALLVCAALFFSLGAAVSAQASSPASPTSPEMHDVVDGYGRTVHIPVNPSRIVSLAPSLTETVYALGVEDRLVGDTDYCDYPPDAQKKPKVGGVINPNLEQIAALHPDLVLLSKEGNMLATVSALDSLHIPTYATDAHSIEQIITSVQKLADVLNASAAGRTLADGLQQRLQALQDRLTDVAPRRVLFIVWPEPLQSVGKNTFVADALRRAGAVSIVDSNQDWPQVSLEEVAKLQPDYLIFAASHTGSPGNDFDFVAHRTGWQLLNAVRDRRYVVVSDAIIRTSPRIVSVIEDLAHQLHPEVFQQKPDNEKPSNPPTSPPFIKPITSRSQVFLRTSEAQCAL
jgi:iron complex transport system substrate-binding protein